MICICAAHVATSGTEVRHCAYEQLQYIAVATTAVLALSRFTPHKCHCYAEDVKGRCDKRVSHTKRCPEDISDISSYNLLFSPDRYLGLC